MTASPMMPFPKALGLFSLLILGICILLVQIDVVHVPIGFSVFVVLFFAAFSIVLHRMLMKAEAQRYQKLINTYLAGSMVRMLLGALLLFILIKVYPEVPIMELGAIFIAVYIAYLFFEAIFVSAQLRNK